MSEEFRDKFFLMMNREDSRTILGRAKARLRRLVGWRLWLSLPRWFHQEPLEILALRGDLCAQEQLAKSKKVQTEHIPISEIKYLKFRFVDGIEYTGLTLFDSIEQAYPEDNKALSQKRAGSYLVKVKITEIVDDEVKNNPKIFSYQGYNP